MKRVLVLDDMQERHDVLGRMLRARGHEVVAVYSYAEAVEALKGPRFDEMYLDHDLEDFAIVELDTAHGIAIARPNKAPEFTGADVAEAIAAMPAEKHPEHVVIHSWNPEGARRMWIILQRQGIQAVRQAFDERWV